MHDTKPAQPNQLIWLEFKSDQSIWLTINKYYLYTITTNKYYMYTITTNKYYMYTITTNKYYLYTIFKKQTSPHTLSYLIKVVQEIKYFLNVIIKSLSQQTAQTTHISAVLHKIIRYITVHLLMSISKYQILHLLFSSHLHYGLFTLMPSLDVTPSITSVIWCLSTSRRLSVWVSSPWQTVTVVTSSQSCDRPCDMQAVLCPTANPGTTWNSWQQSVL